MSIFDGLFGGNKEEPVSTAETPIKEKSEDALDSEMNDYFEEKKSGFGEMDGEKSLSFEDLEKEIPESELEEAA